MIVKKIICDVCRKEIPGHAIKINAEFIDNNSGNLIDDASADEEPVWGADRDYCYTCFSNINDYICTLVNGKCDRETKAAAVEHNITNQAAAVEPDITNQAAAVEQTSEIKTDEKPIKTETENTSDENTLIGIRLRPHIRHMIINGFDNDAIADKLKCPKKYIYDERSKLKHKMVECTQEVMARCIYSDRLSYTKESDLYCNYLEKEGHIRGCDTEHCIRFKEREEKKNEEK